MAAEGCFLRLVRRMNPGLSPGQVSYLWSTVDKTKDGDLSFQGFQSVLTAPLGALLSGDATAPAADSASPSV